MSTELTLPILFALSFQQSHASFTFTVSSQVVDMTMTFRDGHINHISEILTTSSTLR